MMTDTNKSISNKEAIRAYQGLNGNSKTELGDVIEKLNTFQEYLSDLCRQICKKGLKTGFVYQWIFTNEVKQKDYDSYYKANLSAASESLSRIIFKLKTNGINEIRKRMLLNVICDLKPFVTRFDDKQDYAWLLRNTNRHITNFYQDLSKNIFWNGIPGNHPEERLVLATSTPFIIRQSIEYKIKRILGIDNILINGRSDIRSMEKCFRAIENNTNFYKVKDFDFRTVKLIHSWTHYYVHSGYRPEPWRTETAIHYLNNFFYSGQTSQSNSYSLYAAVEVNEADLEELNRKTEESIKKDAHGDICIRWLSKPEVAVIGKDKTE